LNLNYIYYSTPGIFLPLMTFEFSGAAAAITELNDHNNDGNNTKTFSLFALVCYMTKGVATCEDDYLLSIGIKRFRIVRFVVVKANT
jgi:hypothetical protein